MNDHPFLTSIFSQLIFQASFGQWQILFTILAGIYIFGAVVYLLGGTGELQSWNNAEPTANGHLDEDTEASHPLKVMNSTDTQKA